MEIQFNHRGIIKRILKDHFDGFRQFHQNLFPAAYRKDIEETVLKAMRCGSSDLGHIRYECLGCPWETKPVFIYFSCKSRFCNKCGKKYTDEWSKKQQDLIFNVLHRHMVFTIPEELRQVFFQDRKKLNELSQLVAQVFEYYFQRRHKKLELKPRIITVIHTFGRDLKFNPHIHVLVTEGAMDCHREWHPLEYISYEYLRKSLQKIVMDSMKKWFPDNLKIKALIDDLYRRYPKGFYVNAEKKMKNAKGAAKYIGRYLSRPAIAEHRILGYDREHVTFWYEDHQTRKRIVKKQTVYRFPYNLIQHIPPKHFRMVGRFGLYSRRSYERASQAMNLYEFVRTKQLSLNLPKMPKRKKSYRERMIEAFNEDPFWCPHYHRKMDLVEVWHAEHGLLYHYMMDAKSIYKT